jgi:sugar phosphate isomerase/epimerase
VGSWRYAICNELFADWALEDVLRFAAETGYAGVELAPFTLAARIDDLSAGRRREIASCAARCGIEIAGLHWLLAGQPDLHVSHPDAAVRARTVSYLEKLIDVCAELGGRTLVFGSGRQRGVLPGVDPDKAAGLARETFVACGRAAARAGVTFCLEALPAADTTLLTTTAEVVDLVREIGDPAVRLVIDMKSIASEPTPMPDQIRLAAPYAAHVHANDANRRGPGFGDTDFGPIFRALREVAYSGYVSVEVFDNSPDPQSVAHESLHYMRAAARPH